MPAARAIFFDLDGTLADSLHVLKQVYFGFLHAFGHSGSQQEFATLNGPPLSEVLRRLKDTYALSPDTDELLTMYRDLVASAYDAVDPCHGAHELLQTLHGDAWRIGIVTSNDATLAHRWLTRVGFADYIQFVIGHAQVTRGKPFPDPYIAAIAQAGCPVEHSYAVEDSLAGATAATAAGLITYVVTHDDNRATADWPHNAYRVSDLTQLYPHLQRVTA